MSTEDTLRDSGRWQSQGVLQVADEERKRRNEAAGQVVALYALCAPEPCFDCGHPQGEHDEKDCRGGEDIACRCDSYIEPEPEGK
jgi:hypothetical protein